MTDILLVSANAIAGIGVIGLVAGHGIIAAGNKGRGFKFSGAGSLLVAISAIMLNSWPVFVLNAIWLWLSIQGVRNLNKPDQSHTPGSMAALGNLIVPITFVLGVIALAMGFYSIAAWACTCIYLIGYYLLSSNSWSNNRYLLWTLLAYFLLVIHLIETNQFMVLFNESLGALFSLSGLIKSKLITPSNEGAIAANE